MGLTPVTDGESCISPVGSAEKEHLLLPCHLAVLQGLVYANVFLTRNHTVVHVQGSFPFQGLHNSL